MASNLPAITAALRTRIATATGLTTVYAYKPDANSVNLCFFVLDRWEILDPPLGAQMIRWIYEGAFTVAGTKPETIQTNIQARLIALLDVMRMDLHADTTIGNGYILVREGTGDREVIVGKLALPGAGFTIEVKEQIDGAYGTLG